MTAAKLIGYGLALGLISALSKLVFYRFLNFESIFIILILYVFIILCTIAFVRRLGVINYLESFIIMVSWFILSIPLDLVFVGLFLGTEPYQTFSLWLVYPTIMLTVFLSHKKRHIDIRKGGEGK